MSQLDALKLVDSLRERLVDLGVSENFSGDPHLVAAIRSVMSQVGPSGLLGDIWVEATRASRSSGKSLTDCADVGLFNSELAKHLVQNGEMPSELRLYEHQYQSLETAVRSHSKERPAIAVTAGTGGGKTESFLLPLLNQLYAGERQPGGGIRALILYPMNALVNDQTERLDRWLSGQDRVSYLHFTSETPEDARQATREGLPPAAPHRYRTRQQARGKETSEGKKTTGGLPPDILITNYSMLEYMLCRPQDAVFFGPALEVMVLDEAHLYAGTLAAEIMLLLRRMMLRCGVWANQILQIATSATLGGGREELKDFVGRLFSSQPESTFVIRGEPAAWQLESVSADCPEKNSREIADTDWLQAGTIIEKLGQQELLVDADECKTLAEQLQLVVDESTIRDAFADSAGCPAMLLWKVLPRAQVIHEIAALMDAPDPKTLDELTSELWGSCDDITRRATTNLLRLAASARPEVTRLPLLPHRLHLQVRAPNALSVCLFPSCESESLSKLPPLGSVTADTVGRCSCCESPSYPIIRCGNCGLWGIAATESNFSLLPTKVTRAEPGRVFFPLSNVFDATNGKRWTVDPASGSCRVAQGVELYEFERCPTCGEKDFGWLRVSDSLSLSIATETILSELPALSAGRTWHPAEGRRLLAFSDSRQAAARLGPRLASQHQLQMFRAMLAKHANEGRRASDETRYVREDVERLEREIRSRKIGEDRKRYVQRQLDEKRRELSQRLAGGTIREWVERLEADPLIAQFLDPDLADLAAKQPAQRPWRQLDWDKNRESVKKRIRDILANELARRPRNQVSAETIGLVAISYPGIEQLSLDDHLLGQLNAACRLKLERVFADFCRLICDVMRIEGCIDLGSQEKNREFGSALTPVGKWMAARTSTASGWLVNLIGKTQNQITLNFACRVLIAAGESDENARRLAEELLENVFSELVRLANDKTVTWLKSEPRQTDDGNDVEAVQLVFPELGLAVPQTVYECELNGWLWPRNAAGCVPQSGSGSLREIDVTQPDADMALKRFGRLRRDYNDREVFQRGLWAEEHSAQLSPRETRRLQNLFRQGARNLLSCTTTMELGIDIGGLQAVMMANVPPGKANYVQRAGRSGRRSDGSSAAITFCQDRPRSSF